MPYSRQLATSECEALLRGGVVGRVAVSTPGGPHIVPINYSIVGSAIILRTTPYSVLGSHGRDSLLAFEVDYFDHAHKRGWSVVARGRADVVHERVELNEIERSWPPQPWVTGPRPLFLKLAWNEISGRQLGDDWDPHQTLPQHAAPHGVTAH
jgi:nitroimidazol reductase NimA-like FMN-containing flavoprotein (pyridoxamine 5'-phosphate oxidase superfamily)